MHIGTISLSHSCFRDWFFYSTGDGSVCLGYNWIAHTEPSPVSACVSVSVPCVMCHPLCHIWAIGEDSISLIRDVENRNGKFVIGRLYRGDYGILVEIFDTTGVKKAKDIDLQTIAPIKFDWCYALGA